MEFCSSNTEINNPRSADVSRSGKGKLVERTLLQALRCPVTREPLMLFDDVGRSVENSVEQIQSDKSAQLTLRNASQTLEFPIREGILDLRPESGKAISARTLHLPRREYEVAVSERVQNWYDQFGWQWTDDGRHCDTAFFSTAEGTPYSLYESLSHYAQKQHFPGGRLLLDAASGAIAHSEYLSYSESHDLRVCVDFSIVALRQARERLAGRGLFVQANVLHLPFNDRVFDGVISGYTVQHIHKDEQRAAVVELYRVLGPFANLVILATQATDAAHARLLRWLHCWQSGKGGKHSPGEHLPGNTDSPVPPHELYGHVFPFDWWRQTAQELTDDFSVECLRLLSCDEFSRLRCSVRDVMTLRGLETLFSRRLARYSTLISVVLRRNC